MNLLDKIGREFSGYNLLESEKRIFDRCKAMSAPMPVYPVKARLHHEGGHGIFGLILRRDGTVPAV